MRIKECDFDAKGDVIIAALRATLKASDLDDAYKMLVADLSTEPDYAVGRGASHIWIHDAAVEDGGKIVTTDNRVILITE